MIAEQVRVYFGIAEDGPATANIPLERDTPEEQHNEFRRAFQGFLKYYQYGTSTFLDEHVQVAPPRAEEIVRVWRVVGQLANGIQLVAPENVVRQQAAPEPAPAQDEVFTYCNNLCHWVLQIMQMSDTAKEADTSRVIPNLMANIPFFYSHSSLSKYFVECLDYILKVREASPQMKSRILEGSFANSSGGKGKNCESDLRQEHSVGKRKKLIKMLGANKTDAAMTRVTNAADTISDIISKFDTSLEIGQKSGRHTHSITEENEALIKRTIAELKPFNKQPGRSCLGFRNIQTVYDKIDPEKMKIHITNTVNRLTLGMGVVVEEEEEVEEIEDSEQDSSDDEVDNHLPPL